MDRQSLLEQKRQRLQELKQRRLGNADHDDKLVNKLINQFQSSPTQPNKLVNVAIQVDIAPQENEVNYISNITSIHDNLPDMNEKCVMMYDKAIQATDEPSDIETELRSTIADKKDENAEPIKNDEVVVIEECKLNTSMRESFKFLNKIITQEAIDSSILKTFSEGEHLKTGPVDNVVPKNDPFQLKLDIPLIKDRLIKYIDISPHYPELIVASYSLKNSSINQLISNQVHLNSISQPPGLAIIYNVKSLKAFPEYFLHCTSAITEIKFDKVNPHKVIGGLSDGKVVIWDLLDNRRNSVAILPLLMTPILSNVTSSIINNEQQAVNFIHHANEITSINQIQVENNDCIISTSFDGVINLWSSNLLAWPKVSSLKLSRPNNNAEVYAKKELLFISKVLMLQEENDLARFTLKELSSQPPAYKFLNKLLVGTNEGKLYRLSNDIRKGYIELSYEEDNKDNENPLHFSSITSIMELLIDGQESIIATSNVDWTIKIWKSNQRSPILQIPVNYLILDMKARPNYPLQFLTLGIFNQSINHELSPIIDFWDTSRKLMNPICSISLESKNEANADSADSKLYATTARFDVNGSSIIIGFNDGSMLIWSIDEIVLNEVIDSKTKSDIDDGIIEFLHRKSI